MRPLITVVRRRDLIGDQGQRGDALPEMPNAPGAALRTRWTMIDQRNCLGDNALVAGSISPACTEHPMTTVEIELPEATAQAAMAAGLLTPQAIDRLLSNALRKRDATRYLRSVAAEVAAAGVAPPSMEETDAEVKIVRAERRARANRN